MICYGWNVYTGRRGDAIQPLYTEGESKSCDGRRRAGTRRGHGPGGVRRPQPVVVDGVLFPSISKAAAEIGVDGTTLSRALRRGGGRAALKGRKTLFADTESDVVR